MAVNDLTVSQASSVLNALVSQATGTTALATTEPGSFVSVAQTALKSGYDPVLQAISQVWSRTIYSTRPYSRKLAGMEMPAPVYGNAIRKLTPISTDVEDDAGSAYPVFYDGHQVPPTGDGKSVDQFIIKKPKVVQTNFYGTSVYQDPLTIFKDQLDVAFSSPEEFMQFNTMNLQEEQNKLEQFRENVARGLLINLIGSILDEKNPTRVVHLLTEYNAETGLKLTANTVYQPANYRAFIQWVYARIRTIANLMSNRSELYQTQLTGKRILRHTPASELKIYLSNKVMEQINAMTLSDTYHDNRLALADWEGVDYWQSIKTPDSINCTPTYTDVNGTIKTSLEPVIQANIFGVMFDRMASGYGVIQEDVDVSPFDARGRYWTQYWSAKFRTIQDMTEKAVVLLLD